MPIDVLIDMPVYVDLQVSQDIDTMLLNVLTDMSADSRPHVGKYLVNMSTNTWTYTWLTVLVEISQRVPLIHMIPKLLEVYLSYGAKLMTVSVLFYQRKSPLCY